MYKLKILRNRKDNAQKINGSIDIIGENKKVLDTFVKLLIATKNKNIFKIKLKVDYMWVESLAIKYVVEIIKD